MKFSKHGHSILLLILITVVTIVLITRFKLTNDEVYYLAFARDPQLSYVDSPPFVSYLTWLPLHYHYNQAYILRLAVAIIHMLSTLMLARMIPATTARLNMILIAYLCPIFGIYGIFILPDAGLLLGLSIMITAADKIYQQKTLNIYESIWLGLGLGIGLLSKYHIIPLGGAIISGLLIHLLHYHNYRIWKPLFKSSLIILITGSIISLPMWIWNLQYHFVSFKFQLQHGFAQGQWSLSSAVLFLGSSILFITPWFTYFLIRYGLLRQPRLYLILPFSLLFIILLASSLRKNVLGHWISPAFWILIPYMSRNLEIYGSHLNKKILAYCYAITALLWILAAIPLALPGGMNNLRAIILKTNHDLSNVADLFLWDDLKNILSTKMFNEYLGDLHQQQLSSSGCNSKQELIGTTDWMVTAHFEYSNLLANFTSQHANYRILNLNVEHANFYLWRDELSQYNGCPILIITYRDFPNYLQDIVEVKKQHTLNKIPDYQNLKLNLILGQFKNPQSIIQAQHGVKHSGHY